MKKVLLVIMFVFCVSVNYAQTKDFNVSLPNKLFQDTKKIKDTKTIVDPNGKEKNSFVEY
jgi:biopolymer transport protein ExbD